MPLNFNGTEVRTLKMGTTAINEMKVGTTSTYQSKADVPSNITANSDTYKYPFIINNKFYLITIKQTLNQNIVIYAYNSSNKALSLRQSVDTSIPYRSNNASSSPYQYYSYKYHVLHYNGNIYIAMLNTYLYVNGSTRSGTNTIKLYKYNLSSTITNLLSDSYSSNDVTSSGIVFIPSQSCIFTYNDLYSSDSYGRVSGNYRCSINNTNKTLTIIDSNVNNYAFYRHLGSSENSGISYIRYDLGSSFSSVTAKTAYDFWKNVTFSTCAPSIPAVSYTTNISSNDTSAQFIAFLPNYVSSYDIPPRVLSGGISSTYFRKIITDYSGNTIFFNAASIVVSNTAKLAVHDYNGNQSIIDNQEIYFTGAVYLSNSQRYIPLSISSNIGSKRIYMYSTSGLNNFDSYDRLGISGSSVTPIDIVSNITRMAPKIIKTSEGKASQELLTFNTNINIVNIFTTNRTNIYIVRGSDSYYYIINANTGAILKKTTNTYTTNYTYVVADNANNLFASSGTTVYELT